MDTVEPVSLYERDEHQWMQEQIALLRAGRLDALDREHLIAFLVEMTIRDRRELENHFVVLLQDMLKFLRQPQRASRSWVRTIVEQQDQIEAMLKSTPSLRAYADGLYQEAYPRAVRLAAAETGLAAAGLPAANPWLMADALAYQPPTPATHPSRPRRR